MGMEHCDDPTINCVGIRKMTNQFRQRLYELHRSAGAFFGVFLFIILWSGIWSLVNHKLGDWWHIFQMTSEQSIIEPIVTLHKNLFIGFPGRIFISLFGIALAVISILGLWLHQRKLKDWFKLRWNSTSIVVMADSHRLLGLWTLPYLLFFSITGAIAGLGALGTVTLSNITHSESPQMVFMDLMGGPIPKASGEIWSNVPDILAIKAQDQRLFPNFTLQKLIIHNEGDQNAVVELSGVTHGVISPNIFEKHVYSLNGDLYKTYSAENRGLWLQSYIANQPLHYGEYDWLPNWGNFWFILHLVMAIGALWITGSGLYLWMHRNQSQWQPWQILCWKKIPIGILAGLVLASNGILLCGLVANLINISMNNIITFLSIWSATIIATVLWMHHINRFFIMLILVNGFVLVFMSVVHLSLLVAEGIWANVLVDIILLLVGIFILVLGLRRKNA